jgi:hypothetical protein
MGAKYVVVGLPNKENDSQIVAANQCGGTRELTEDAQPLIIALREASDEG